MSKTYTSISNFVIFPNIKNNTSSSLTINSLFFYFGSSTKISLFLFYSNFIFLMIYSSFLQHLNQFFYLSLFTIFVTNDNMEKNEL